MDTNDRIIPSTHDMWLHLSLGLQEHETLPEKLVSKYWEIKLIFDRMGAQVTAREIGFLAWQLGYGKPTEKEKAPLTVVQMWRKKQIKEGASVQVKWKNGQWVEGTLRKVTGNDEVVVQPIGEPDEIRFKVDDVKVAA